MPETDSGATVTVDRRLASTLESVDAAEELILGVAQQLELSREDAEALSMAVREAMVNAVVHGNRYNANKWVHLRAMHTPEKVLVEITDEGEGFDPSQVPDPLKTENLLQQSGRGLLLIRAFVDELEITRAAPAGMTVRLVKRRTSTG